MTFVQSPDAKEATVQFQNKAADAQLTTHFDASGSSISYKLPNNTLPSQNSKFTVTITLPADFVMNTLNADFDMGSVTVGLTGSENDYAFDASVDMGKLTIGGKTYHESYHSFGRRPAHLTSSMGNDRSVWTIPVQGGRCFFSGMSFTYCTRPLSADPRS